MTRSLVRSGLAVLAICALASTASAQDGCGAEAQLWEDAFNAENAAGVAALYTEDGMLRHSDGAVDRGREEVQAWAQGAIEAGLSIDVTEQSFEQIVEGVMVGIGSWTLFDADGAEFLAGEYMTVTVSHDGACLIKRHFSATVRGEEM